MMYPQAYKSLFACAALSVAACQPTPPPAAPATQPVAAAPAAAVVRAPVQERDVANWVAITGTLIAQQRTQLSANAAGRVLTTRVERGQAVKQGDVLLTLDVRAASHGAKEARANLSNLQAQQTTAKQDCKRYEVLHEKKVISQQEYERTMAQCRELDAQFEAAEARVAEALRTLNDGEIRAPFAGIVTERSVQVGDYVRQDSAVATLLAPDPLRLKCTVPESEAAYVVAGAKVSFAVGAFGNRSFDGTLQYISGEVRETSRDIVFEAAVPNVDHALLPGMFASGRLYGPSQKKIVVPKTAVVSEDGKSFVYRIAQNRLLKHAVRVGELAADGIVVEEGLQADDVVAQTASSSFVDGQSVP